MNILLADDHIMTLDGYISILNNNSYTFFKAQNCEEVHNLLLKNIDWNIAIIDYNMPAFKEQRLLSGVDCALQLRKHSPNCRIILITAHEEALKLYDIYRKTSLNALIVKSDFTTSLFKELVTNNTLKLPYYSPRAESAFREITTKTTLLDSKNREILIYLSHGFKTSQLEQFVSLSTSAIQKRVSKMLQEFNVSDYQSLIQFAKKENLL